MSESERAAALEAIQLELFALDREYGDLVADFYAKRRQILRRRQLILHATRVARVGMKRCRKCGADKDVSEFYQEARYADGRRPYCIQCDLARMRDRQRKGNVISRGRRSEAA
jgi:hypothetical protein